MVCVQLLVACFSERACLVLSSPTSRAPRRAPLPPHKEMSAISPLGLLSSSGRGPSAEPVVAGGVGDNGIMNYRRHQDHGGGREGGGSPERLISSPVHEDDHDDDHHHHLDGHGSGAGGARARKSGGGGGSGGNGYRHSHSHGLGAEGDGVWVRLALLLALSVHSVMEGLGVGAKSTKAYNLLFAIGVHKVLVVDVFGVRVPCLSIVAMYCLFVSVFFGEFERRFFTSRAEQGGRGKGV